MGPPPPHHHHHQDHLHHHHHQDHLHHHLQSTLHLHQLLHLHLALHLPLPTPSRRGSGSTPTLSTSRWRRHLTKPWRRAPSSSSRWTGSTTRMCGREVVHSQRKTRDMKPAAGGKGGRTGSIERMFPALLLTRTVAQVEVLIKKSSMERAQHSERLHTWKLQTKKQKEARG